MDTVSAFLKVLDPADNSTGGGTACALAGGMAAALAAMVARLSVGKSLPKPDAFYQALSANAETLARELTDGGAQDAEAFDAVKAAYRLARDTPASQAARSAAIQAALIRATELPLDNAERCGRVLDLCDQLQGRANPNALSDLQCAGYLARAGLAGCLANVAINLAAIKDPHVARRFAGRAAELRARAQRDDPQEAA